MCPWDGFTPATMTFCEAPRCAWVVAPANTWSNLALVLVGAFLIAREAWGARPSPTVRLVGVTSVLVGVGSFLFHMTATRWGEHLDVGAMLLISALMLTTEARRALGLSARAQVAGYAIVAAGSIAAMLAYQPAGLGLFTAQIAVWTLLALRLARRHGARFRTWQIFAMMATFVAGFTAWNLDVHRIVCDPGWHVVNGHAVWHVANAACLLLYALHQDRVEAAGRPGAATS